MSSQGQSQAMGPMTVEQLSKERFWTGFFTVVQLGVAAYLFYSAKKDGHTFMLYVYIALGVLALLGAVNLFRR